MAKLTSIKQVPKKPSVREKAKVACDCGGDGEGDLSHYHFRLTEVDEIVEVECSSCLGELPPYYTIEAVERMIRVAVADALARRDEEKTNS